MRPNNDAVKRIYKRAKRIAITVLICLPFLIVLAYLLRNIVTHNWMQILMFTFILAVVVVVVELIFSKKEKDKQKQEVETKDVYK